MSQSSFLYGVKGAFATVNSDLTVKNKSLQLSEKSEAASSSSVLVRLAEGGSEVIRLSVVMSSEELTIMALHLSPQ